MHRIEASETTKPPEIESNLTKLLEPERKQPLGKPSGNWHRGAIMEWDTERNIMRALVVLPGSWAVAASAGEVPVLGILAWQKALQRWSALLGYGKHVTLAGCSTLPIPPSVIILIFLNLHF